MLELLSLRDIIDGQGVQETGTADLELGLASVLDLHGLGVLAPGNFKKLFDVLDALGLRRKAMWNRGLTKGCVRFFKSFG